MSVNHPSLIRTRNGGVQMTRLTKQQVNEFKSLMEAQLAQLVDKTQNEMSVESKQNYVYIESDVGDAADEAFADTTVDIDNAMIGVHLDKVWDLRAALDRMKTGSYGVCIDCGNDVDFKRLFAYPVAKRCLRCQRLHEKTFARKAKYSY
jgi:DnaK suppressor protein